MGETKRMEVQWEQGLRFRAGIPGGPATIIDSEATVAPGPMATLIGAAAACSATDVVMILGKMRQPLAALTVEIEGDRREEEPRRYVALRLRFRARGEGLDLDRLRRAVELSVARYCSVMASLAPDIAITWEAVVEA